MPKRMLLRVRHASAVTNSSDRSYSSGFPTRAGHQRRGLLKRSCGKLSGVKLTNALSCGASVTAWLKLTFRCGRAACR